MLCSCISFFQNHNYTHLPVKCIRVLNIYCMSVGTERLMAKKEVGGLGLSFSLSKQRSRCALNCKLQQPETHRSMPKEQEGFIHSFIYKSLLKTYCVPICEQGRPDSCSHETMVQWGRRHNTDNHTYIIITIVVSARKEEKGHQEIYNENQTTQSEATKTSLSRDDT